jgi:hypothetical protein
MPIQSMLQLPSARYALTIEQRQRLEHAATALPAEQRPLFRQRIQQIIRTPMGRGITTDAVLGLAIRCATRELTEATVREPQTVTVAGSDSEPATPPAPSAQAARANKASGPMTPRQQQQRQFCPRRRGQKRALALQAAR